jgi:hypothetical protein
VWRDQHRARSPARRGRLAVEQERGVELARTPAAQHLPHLRVVDTEPARERGQVGRERDDRAHVEVAIRPAVEAAADARDERVVDRRVAQRAADADRREAALRIEAALHADDRVELQQRERDRRIREVHLPVREPLAQARGQCGGVDLQADAERGRGRQRRERFVEPEPLAPERLGAEGVVPEDLPALAHEPRGGEEGRGVAIDGGTAAALRLSGSDADPQQRAGGEHRERHAFRNIETGHLALLLREPTRRDRVRFPLVIAGTAT